MDKRLSLKALQTWKQKQADVETNFLAQVGVVKEEKGDTPS
jgi:hypothetical protein